jgi:hypothetical protein
VLASYPPFQRTGIDLVDGAGVVTYTNGAEAARNLVEAIVGQREARDHPPNPADLERLLGEVAYTVSETRPVDGGFERTTRSAFGQFGTIIAQLTPETSRQK